MYNKIKDGLINGSKDHKSFKELFIDSFKFTFKKPSAILFLGLFLFVISIINILFTFSQEHFTPIFSIIFFEIISIIFSIYESGYCCLIFEDSIKGISKPPSIFNYKEILAHGLIDFIVYMIYMLSMIFIQTIIFLYIDSQTNLQITVFLKVINVFIGGLFILLMYISLINLSLNNVNFKSAFNFKELLKILHSIGLLRFIVILFIINFANILMVHTLDISHNFVAFAINLFFMLIVTPSLLLFSKRLLIMSVLH